MPVGAPAPGAAPATTAVRVAGCPYTAGAPGTRVSSGAQGGLRRGAVPCPRGGRGRGREPGAVAVGTVSGAAVAVVLASRLASPLYAAVMSWVPAPRADVVQVATPVTGFTGRAAQSARAAPPARNSTVPPNRPDPPWMATVRRDGHRLAGDQGRAGVGGHGRRTSAALAMVRVPGR